MRPPQARTFRARAYLWSSVAALALAGVLVWPPYLSLRPLTGSPLAAPASMVRVISAAAEGQDTQTSEDGPVVIERTFWSPALGRTMPYSVYLPTGYTAAGVDRYPVLYMLHGLGGDHIIEWRAYGIVERAEALRAAGAIRPMIIVLPEGEDGYWLDHADGGPAWGRYLADDVVAEIDAHFRTIPTREGRAIGGNSMGGHGALQLAMNYPQRFGIAGMHSPTLRDHASAPAYFGDRSYFEAHDPASLVRAQPAVARSLRLWLDGGDQDGWLPPVLALHEELDALAVPHEFHVLPGIHEDDYWTAHLDQYLRFYSRALG